MELTKGFVHAARIIARIGRGTKLAKIDIAHAYRNVPVHPTDRCLLGMQWGDGVYVDAALHFGLHSAPKIFSAISDTLEWVLRQKGISSCLHYLDDFLTLGSPSLPECSQNLRHMQIIGYSHSNTQSGRPHNIIDFLGHRTGYSADDNASSHE